MRILILAYSLLCFALVSFGTEDSTHLSTQELIEEGRFDSALETLEPKLANNPSFSDLYNVGLVYAKQKKYRKALGAFESALKINPSNTEAQANAAFVHAKITDEVIWKSPFSWTVRMVVAFRSFWIPAILVSSLIFAIILFLYVSKVNVGWSWIKKLWLPTLMILVISVLSLNKLHEFHSNHHLAIGLVDQPPLYISPDGVPVEGKNNIPLRVNIQAYSKDSSWVSIEKENERFWLKSEDLFIY